MDGQNGETRIGSIPTNLRMLLVLEEIAQSGVPVTPTEVNQRIGLPKPTIHRLFATLEAEGFIMRELDGKSYTPGKRLRRLASGAAPGGEGGRSRVGALSRRVPRAGPSRGAGRALGRAA